MNEFTISIPGKTFILGEYLALSGEASLIANTNPRFELAVKKHDLPLEKPKHNFPDNGPAAKLIKDNQTIFNHYECDFSDPFNGLGGFGASSARFLMAYYLLQHHLEPNFKINTIDIIQNLLDTYQRYAWDGLGLIPSGADVIGQIYGQLTLFQRNTNKVSTFDWPFTDSNFIIAHTGVKIPTHEHLKELKITSLPIHRLKESMFQAMTYIRKKDEGGFVETIQNYYRILLAYDLVAPHTQHLVKAIQNQPGVKAAKGCGALGADVIFVMLKNKASDDIKNLLKLENLTIIASKENLSRGIHVDS